LGSILNHANLFHTGLVVDDVESAKAEYSDVAGVEWGPEGEVEMPVWLLAGPQTISFRFAYTTEGPHRIELVRHIPDTIWTSDGGGRVHHLGYWCDDIAGASKELALRGAPLCARVGVDNPDDPAPFLLHRLANGSFIELVDIAARTAMFGEQP
jgi:hypothetical protein